MSGVKAGLSTIPQGMGGQGNPVANSGKGEPSIDDILASIRQIISDQNLQADNAAEKAAAEVANKAPAHDNVSSIIGSVASDHWSGRSAPSPVSPAIAPAIVSPVNQSSYPGELDELIQLIATFPPAPRAQKPSKWIDPQSKQSPMSVSKPGMAGTERVQTSKGASVNLSAAKIATDIPKYTLNRRENNQGVQQKLKPAPRLHPSISPKTDVPQIIKDAIILPSAKPPSVLPASANVAKSGAVQNSANPSKLPKPPKPPKPIVDQKSALDRLIARKGGVSARSDVTIPPTPQAKQPMMQPGHNPITTKPMQAKPSEPAKVSSPARQAVATPPVAPLASAAISTNTVNAAVIKSIERLASSMFEDRKDEIDGMMAGIVRPMLQDWLEDNLPSLVERIVREEIERVSRGTHR